MKIKVKLSRVPFGLPRLAVRVRRPTYAAFGKPFSQRTPAVRLASGAQGKGDPPVPGRG